MNDKFREKFKKAIRCKLDGQWEQYHTLIDELLIETGMPEVQRRWHTSVEREEYVRKWENK